jgi:hypothetical protein
MARDRMGRGRQRVGRYVLVLRRGLRWEYEFEYAL